MKYMISRSILIPRHLCQRYPSQIRSTPDLISVLLSREISQVPLMLLRAVLSALAVRMLPSSVLLKCPSSKRYLRVTLSPVIILIRQTNLVHRISQEGHRAFFKAFKRYILKNNRKEKIIMLNLVALTGRITHDPEMRSTATGVPVTSISIAINKANKRFLFFMFLTSH